MIRKAQKKQKETPDWKAMKSGVLRHKSGWHANGQYIDGWYFYTADRKSTNLGPYKSFEEGLKEWKKLKK